jgi:cobalt-precorrin-7 (C5)-methyltransferase
MAKISIVGAGPGSEDYVTPIARRTVQNADIVVGADRALVLFADDIKHEAMKLTAKTMRSSLRRAVDLAKQGKSIAILSTGDPGFSGLLKTFLKFNKGRDFEIEVVPGISSLQVCAARVGLPWDEVEFFTFHEGATMKEKESLAKAVGNGRTVMLLPDAKDFSPSEIAKFLLKRGVSEKTQAFVCENLTLDDEKTVQITLLEASKVVFGSLCVMVIKPSLQQ